jgi:primosomal protein N' (replication factor Y)
MTSYARVAVNVPSMAGVFDYAVPEALAGQVMPGSLITVPFGRQTVQAVVLDLPGEPSVAETRELLSVLDPEPVLTGAQIRLARHISESTLTPMAAAVGLFLPPGIAREGDTQYSVSSVQSSVEELGEVQKRVVRLLEERGPLRGRQIDQSLAGIEWRKAASSLVKRGVLESRSVLPPARVRPKYIRTAQLAVPLEAAEGAMRGLGNTAATQRRREKALRYLMARPEAINVSWVYAESGCNLADLQELAQRQLINLMETEEWRDPLQHVEQRITPRAEIAFSDEQAAAWKQIAAGIEQAADGKKVKPFLLQGVTGSGKTEIYIRAACETVACGRQAIILVPEIALTPQTVQRFLQRFPGQTGLIHSRLSDGERYDTWRRARMGKLQVIIGARSALFAPLPNLGLIVVDECHDASYYQSDPPFYNAARLAQAYAEISSAACILGSATPSLGQRRQSEMGGSVRLELSQRVGPRASDGTAEKLDMPAVRVVDMREELTAGNRGILSRELRAALEHTLERGEQAILFMNRRGSATYVFCRTCGYAMKCPRCDTPLTYHAAVGETVLCHHCGYTRPMPRKCPECGNLSMRAYGLGTEKVEAQVQREFPSVRTLRWDWETTHEKNAHEVILAHFAAGRADVLIGTQMLAKGLDLPRVTLVGMVLADVGLFLPDPFAAERVFQVLTQVAGRAGRRALGGRVILQTFVPEHYAIRAAAAQDVDAFYRDEAAQRRRLGYPPFTGLLRLEVRHSEAGQAEREAQALAVKIRRQILGEKRKAVNILGPVPCFYGRLEGKYRWQIILRGADLRGLLPERLSPNWRIEVEPVSLL